MGTLAFSPAVVTLFAILIEERTGLGFKPGDHPLLASKLEACAGALGVESAIQYYYLVRDEPTPMVAFDRLVDAIVVNETYFFREADQLTVLCETVILPLCQAGRRPRVWSAACSSGEEPFTLAILLDGMGLLSSVDIVASDICNKALEHAKKGSYGERSLRAIPDGVVGRWLERADGRVSIAQPLRDAIEWRRINLVDDDAIRALGALDAILCRNVLIYFSDDTVRRVMHSLSGSLNDSAPLLVGAAESLLQFGSELKWGERSGAFFHVRA